jgi:hypothetical protein
MLQVESFWIVVLNTSRLPLLRHFYLVTGSHAEVYRVNHASTILVEIYTVPTKTTTKDLGSLDSEF